MKYSKSRKHSARQIRKVLGQQLRFLRRNLNTIAQLAEQTSLTLLDRRQYKSLLVIHELYRQQQWMYENCCHRISGRIVSISQPHVRPIVRGKASAPTEFGAKLSASLVNGFVFLDRLDWNPFNESGDLIEQIETYKQRFGCYPESVHCDAIYRTRDNRRYCKKQGSIRMSGPPLGRPPKKTPENTPENTQDMLDRKLQQRQDELDRIPIEGKFGQGKRRFRQMTRSSMLEVLRQDYIRTAKAKGLSRTRVVFKHALRNGLIPVITVIGLQFGILLGGAILTETVFAWRGVGKWLFEGVVKRDYMVIQGGTMIVAATFVMVNLIVDILYAVINPRISNS